MRIAVIDCGTNTFNLLVADAGADGWKTVFQTKLPVKLGQGGFEEHTILPNRFVRGLDAMQIYRETMRNYGCQKIFAFATSAIREATNGMQFVTKVRELFGIEIEVIAGDREAQLIYEGVRQSIQMENDVHLIMDIGGGSTEFVIADDKQIFWKESFLLGVSRLHDLVKPEERMSAEDIHYMDVIMDRILGSLREALKTYNPGILIGSSGSFDTLVSMHYHQSGIDRSQIGLSNELPLNSFRSIHRWLMTSTTEERLKHPAIPSMRAEFMPLSTCLIDYVLRMHSFKKILQSAYSLKEGAIAGIISSIAWPKNSSRENAAQNEGENDQ